MSAAAKCRAAAQAGGITARWTWQRLARPQAITADDVPTRLSAISTEWLTAALCRDTPGAAVEHVEIGALSEGTTSRWPMTVTYDAAGSAAGLPTRLFVKTTFPLVSRFVTGPSGVVANEAAFYTHIRPQLDLETPHGYHCVHDPRGHASVFLLEDVAATRGARFLMAGTSVDRPTAEGMVRQLAQLHSAFWLSPRLGRDFPWLTTPPELQRRFNDSINFEKRTLMGADAIADRLPPGFAARRNDLWAAMMRSIHDNARAPETLLHHDPHLGNWYAVDAGPALYDWQLTVRGHWASDVAYALQVALTVDDRRAWERELLAHYLEALAVPRGQRPSLDDAWLHYRRQQFHGLFYWAYTLAQGRLQPQMHPRATAETLVERMVTAIDDLGSFASLDA